MPPKRKTPSSPERSPSPTPVSPPKATEKRRKKNASAVSVGADEVERPPKRIRRATNKATVQTNTDTVAPEKKKPGPKPKNTVPAEGTTRNTQKGAQGKTSNKGAQKMEEAAKAAASKKTKVAEVKAAKFKAAKGKLARMEAHEDVEMEDLRERGLRGLSAGARDCGSSESDLEEAEATSASEQDEEPEATMKTVSLPLFFHDSSDSLMPPEAISEGKKGGNDNGQEEGSTWSR